MFKVNDPVFCIQNGEGIVTEPNHVDDEYPIYVEFDDTTERYTEDGKYYTKSPMASLYHGRPKILAPIEPSRLKVDDLIMVRDNRNTEWTPRYFARWNSCPGIIDTVMCFCHGATSKSTNKNYDDVSVWTFWKPYEECK